MSIDPAAFVHPKAHVEGSTVGARTKVWQFASIVCGTVIGADCTVGAGVVLSGPVFGDRCKISSGVVMGPGFKIGDGVFVGPNVVFANDVWPEFSVEGYDDRLLRSGDRWAVIIGNGASIGANAVVLPGVCIGAGAVVAAGAVVDRDLPDGTLWSRDGGTRGVPVNRRSRRMRFAG
jgi:UDP-2-acetamido-3-amino-2,3-dideoxy-glucuronate N-acetyltransferase